MNGFCDHCGEQFELNDVISITSPAVEFQTWTPNYFLHLGCVQAFELTFGEYYSARYKLERCYQLDAVIPKGVPTE